jgi:hypothetical protein
MVSPYSGRHTYWMSFENEAEDVVKNVETYNNFGQAWANNPMYQTFYRNMAIYYSTIIEPNAWDTGLVFTGKQGELIKMMVPQAMSLTRQVVGIVTKQKLAFQCTADSKSQDVIEVTRLGNALLKSIVEQQKLDLTYEFAVEQSMLTGLCILYTHWRTDKGRKHAKDMEGVQHFQGEVEICAPTVWDLLFDHRIEDPRSWNWVQVRVIRNRWDLIAQHPELKDEILALPSVRSAQGRFMYAADMSPSDEDNIYVYNLYHRPSPALPDGRYIAYGDTKTVFFDGPNIYGELPVYVGRTQPIPQSGFAYPFFSQLVPLQEILDTCVSAIATNNATFAVQNVAVPRGAGINVQQILGMNFFSYTPQAGVPNGGKPEPIQLTQSAPETYKFLDYLERYLRDLSNINSALRGDPPSQVSAGTAIATLTATALETVLQGAKSSRMCLKSAVTGALNCYRRFASVEREIPITGISGQESMKTFRGEDLDPIKDVSINEANPMMQTLTGRIETAREVVQLGLVTNVKGYFAVLEGAQPDELYKKELSEEDLVNRENEDLLTGNEVVVLAGDDHSYHMMMHYTLLNHSKVRLESDLAARVMEHILEHYEISQKTDPNFLAMIRTGKMPEMMPPPPGPPPGAPSGVEPMGEKAQGELGANPAEPARDQVPGRGGR